MEGASFNKDCGGQLKRLLPKGRTVRVTCTAGIYANHFAVSALYSGHCEGGIELGEETIADVIRRWIGSAAWRVFLWANRQTEEQYWRHLDEIAEYGPLWTEIGSNE
jgi:hypothetical protein